MATQAISPTEQSCKQLFLYIFHPQSLRDSPPSGGIGERSPQTPCVATHCVRFPFTPSPFGTAPWGIGERSPQTPCVATHCVRFPFTPSPFGTAPVGHWGAVSPNPLRRYALRALSFHPQSLRDSPGGALGSGLPKPLCVATLRSPLKFFQYYGEKVLCEERQTKKDPATIHPDRTRSVGCGIFFRLTRPDLNPCRSLRRAQRPRRHIQLQLQFLSEPSLRNVKLVTVLGDRAASDLIATLVHLGYQLIICQRLTLVFSIHTLPRKAFFNSRVDTSSPSWFSSPSEKKYFNG